MSAVRVLELPQDVLDSARMTPAELTVEMALHPYAQGRLSIGKARELAGMALWEFRQLLASRRIPPHYDAAPTELTPAAAGRVSLHGVPHQPAFAGHRAGRWRRLGIAASSARSPAPPAA